MSHHRCPPSTGTNDDVTTICCGPPARWPEPTTLQLAPDSHGAQDAVRSSRASRGSLGQIVSPGPAAVPRPTGFSQAIPLKCNVDDGAIPHRIRIQSHREMSDPMKDPQEAGPPGGLYSLSLLPSEPGPYS